MALNDLELSLMTFPQQWVGAVHPSPVGLLSTNVLVLPVGDPTQPLGTGPVFAGTPIHVVANVSAPGDLPSTTSVPVWSSPMVLTPPPVAPALFAQLVVPFASKGITLTSGKLASVSRARIKKSLPDSYTSAIPFERPSTDDVQVGDGYCCELRGQAPAQNAPQVGPDTTIAWGQILSYALRQPALAQALGLIYPLQIPLPAAAVSAGGFLYFTLDASSTANPWVADSQANSDTVKSYAAHLPALRADARPVFAATLMPVVETPSSNLTQAQFEAAEYDDGFAQVVHSNQPTTIDAATLEANRIAPGTDAGVQIGWDDEQITAWMNGQLDLLRVRVDPLTYSPDDTPEAPLGVQGYRVDVRVHTGSGTPGPWISLSSVQGTLPFNLRGVGSGAVTPIDGELWLTPAPVRPSGGTPGAPANDTNDNHAWLPLYFAEWNGTSLVLADQAVRQLAHGFSGKKLSVASQNPRPDLTAVPALRYGTDYDFRVRLVDLTGGGPRVTDAPVHPGPVPTTVAAFRRYVTPKGLLVETDQSFAGYPAVPPPVGQINTLSVKRPRIGYPEALFTGVDASTFAPAALAALISTAKASGGVLDVADPDVDRFTAYVEARIPAHDTGTAGLDPTDVDGKFRVIYAIDIPFGSGEDPNVTVSLDYVDVGPDVSTLEAPASAVSTSASGAVSATLTIPTGRDVRVRLLPRCADKPDYYGTPEAPVGPFSDYMVRKAATAEVGLFSGSPASQLSAMYFQPGSSIPQRLAQQIGISQNGLTFTGLPGQRTVFGASGKLRHTVTADGGAVTFANLTELLGQWIVAVTLTLDRDWTWDGFIQPSAATPGAPLTASAPALNFALSGTTVGAITVPQVIPTSTFAGAGPNIDRKVTQIVFFDAIDAAPAVGHFPTELDPVYTVTANLEAASAQTLSLPITLPITTPPTQTPKIVATGIAESAYAAASDYSSTSPRKRFLWIEFDQPIADPQDNYFGRVLAYGPDSLLAGELAPRGQPTDMLADSTEPALPIDPEPIRAIFPGQASDESGLNAMTELVPALPTGGGAAGTIFMLPLPSGVSSEDLQLFGFWTYEFRIGHATHWSTAQGRFGRPLRVSGIQHPPPTLTCAVSRIPEGIIVSAPYATTLLSGRQVFDTRFEDPRTQLWFMLYAQVMQADGASYRNVLLLHTPGRWFGDRFHLKAPVGGDLRAYAEFPDRKIHDALALIGLPATSSLSVLAVEVLGSGQPVSFPLDVAGIADEREAQAAAFSQATESDQTAQGDPLGADLGTQRILRTSPLTALPAVC